MLERCLDLWCWVMWFKGAVGSVGVTVGLEDLKGPFQP